MSAEASATASGDSKAAKMLTHSVTNALAASTTFTNLQGFTLSSCFKGVVTNTTTRVKVESMTVCSGEVKPHSTVTIQAPYDPDAVVKLCERYRGSGLDWNVCEFTTIEVK